jgi:hypothetical protein
LVSSLLLAVTGCRQLAPTTTKQANPPGAQETVREFFSFLSEDQYDDAKNLLTSGFQSRLGAASVETVLHSVRTARVTDIVDAVAWANRLGAHLPPGPNDRREYLVTLSIQPTPEAGKTWSSGTNRRFIDLVQQGGGWRIDEIGISPGQLVTGRPPVAMSVSDTLKTANDGVVNGVVLPIEPLRLGPVPVDRAIYAARQNAADRGIIPWALDPLQVVHRDGPSFGINPSDQASLIGKDTDPVTLLPRANVLAHQSNLMLVVTLEQLFTPGPRGIWAITDLRESPT